MAPELVRNGPRPGHGFGAGEQRVQFFQGACSFRAGLEANARPGSQVASKNMSNDPALGCSSLPVGGGWAFRILNGHVGTWEALLPPRIQSGTVYDQQLLFPLRREPFSFLFSCSRSSFGATPSASLACVCVPCWPGCSALDELSRMFKLVDAPQMPNARTTLSVVDLLFHCFLARQLLWECVRGAGRHLCLRHRLSRTHSLFFLAANCTKYRT